MKKLLSLALLFGVLAAASIALAVDDPEFIGIKKRQIGANQGTPTRSYVLVRYPEIGNSTASLEYGDVVIWDTVSDDGVTVNRTTTSCDARVAGIVVTTIPTAEAASTYGASDDAGKRNWGYIQVYGLCDAEVGGTQGTQAAGAPVVTSTDATKVTGIESGETVKSSTVGGVMGFFVDAASTSSDVEVFLRLE